MKSILLWIVMQLNTMGVQVNDVMMAAGIVGLVLCWFVFGYGCVYRPLDPPQAWPFIIASFCFVTLLVSAKVAPYHNCDIVDCTALPADTGSVMTD